MTYATQQLTKRLQELCESTSEFQAASPKEQTKPARLEVSPEINRFLEERREYREKTLAISVGSY